MLVLLPLAALLVLTFAAGSYLRGAILFGALVWLGTELLGAFGLIGRTALSLWWIGVAASAAFSAYRAFRTKRRFRLRIARFARDPVVLICAAGLMLLYVLTGVTAAFSPPNSADAMAYHMPRVLYWAEQSSVRFFPAQYLNQIMLQPLAEYFMLHLYVLAAGDRFVNFVQWFGWVGCALGVSLVARKFGANARGQAFAALFCATLPSGVLAASGAKNDCLLAFWLIAAIYFAICFRERARVADAVFTGLAIGLAMYTKATAYVLAPWPVLAILATARLPWRQLLRGAAIALPIALAINTPLYIRNLKLSGSTSNRSVMGFDSAQGDGFFRWRNESFGWRQTTSNMMRNTSEQLGLRSAAWNAGVYKFFLDAHHRLGIDPNDPATTWRWSAWGPPKNANHEADAPNPWHLEILLLVACYLIYCALRDREALPAIYAFSLAAGFVFFCAYLKWQPYLARLFLPLFVLASPLAAVLTRRADGIRTAVLCALSLFLLDTARHPALDNWVRPLRGPMSVLSRPRDAQYFADMTPWNNAGAFQETVGRLAATNCGNIGVDITDFQLEYPLEALLREEKLREKKPGVTFVHTGTDNPSRFYPQPVNTPICAVVCLECKEDGQRLARYADFGPASYAGRFALFVK